jgi:hypothetical protein
MPRDRLANMIDTMKRAAPRGALTALAVAAVALVASVEAALANAAPAGSEWVMADWMLLSFLSFFGAALVAFLVAARRGLLSQMEDAKYHLLSVVEPDYYTPDWAKEDSDAPLR